MRRAAAVALAVTVTIGTLAAQQPILVRREVHLMGTQALVAAYAVDRPAALVTLESAVDSLERTEAQLSTWQRDSALSELNRTPLGVPWRADDSLCPLFRDLVYWHGQTSGAFDPALGALATAWAIHDGGHVPGDVQLGEARARSGLRLLDFDEQACTLTRRAETTIDAGAFGKGEALDRVARTLAGHAWLVDLGGQVSVGGTPPDGQAWIVDVAHPLNRERPIMQVEFRSGSLSTSAGSERDSYVGDVRVGHILDPRTGRPASFAGAVVVWHERGLVADILSTALYVMGPQEGLQWAESRGIAAAYLIPTNDGVSTVATTQFAQLRPAVTSPTR